MQKGIFRARRLDNGEWVTGSLVYHYNRQLKICDGKAIVPRNRKKGIHVDEMTVELLRMEG